MARIWMIPKNGTPQHIGNANLCVPTKTMIENAHKGGFTTLNCGVKTATELYLSDCATVLNGHAKRHLKDTFDSEGLE